jgi:hypothetical protein
MLHVHRIPWKHKAQSVLVLALLVLLGFFWLGHEREPQFESRPLRYWLRELPLTVATGFDDGLGYIELNSATINGVTCGASDTEETSYAAKAVRELGAEVLPALLDELNRRDGRVKLFLARCARQIGYSPHWLAIPADARREQALTAFRILGRNAQTAKPALERLAASNNPKVRDASKLVLQGLSTNGPLNWQYPTLPQWTR